MSIDGSRASVTPGIDFYCSVCYEVVSSPVEHRDNEHDGDMMVDIYSIHLDGDDLIAQPDDMGHFSPHRWIDVDDHDVCAECGAIKVEPEDVPEELRETDE